LEPFLGEGFIVRWGSYPTTCYGYVHGLESELGYFTLEELESVHGPLGLAVERDLSFEPTVFAIIKREGNESR
jgi:hypothetical protein